MRTSIKQNLNNLHLSDIYSLMLFIIYKIQDIPEYAVVSELCYLLDGANLTRLLTYFAGRTITIPTEEEFATMSNALLSYQYVNIECKSLTEAYSKLEDVVITPFTEMQSHPIPVFSFILTKIRLSSFTITLPLCNLHKIII